MRLGARAGLAEHCGAVSAMLRVGAPSEGWQRDAGGGASASSGRVSEQSGRGERKRVSEVGSGGTTARFPPAEEDLDIGTIDAAVKVDVRLGLG